MNRDLSKFFNPDVPTVQSIASQIDLGEHPIARMQKHIGLSNKQAAHRLGISSRHYVRIKMGEISPSRGVLLLIESGAFHRDPAIELTIEKEIKKWKKQNELSGPSVV